MKELLLRALFSCDELNIVHQQHIHGVEAIAEADHAVKPQRVDYLDGELLRAHVTQPHRRIAFLDGMTDGVHQMRLAHPHAAVEEQGVVRFRRLFRDRPRRGVSKLVGLADHKRIEGIAQIQLMIAALKIQLGLPRPGRGRRRCLDGLFLRANVLNFHVGRADFVEHRLDDIPVRAR